MNNRIPFRVSASKIVCFGRTFAKHAAELGNEIPVEPIFFLKAPSAVIADGVPIELPTVSHEVHHEAEVAVVIGERLNAVTPEKASSSIAGWTVLNDVTARDIQRTDQGRFTRAKGFDTFCPIASEYVRDLDWPNARIQCLVNGEIRQNACLSALLMEPAALVSHVSYFMTLMPGDIVSLGTPGGVGVLHEDDRVQVQLISSSGEVLVSVCNPVRRKRHQSSP
jgi:2-keto-4-pentenoate hydratase/2-oxohepta-3-ene-1,7-dioic acid hydratase in catechol pathway